MDRPAHDELSVLLECSEDEAEGFLLVARLVPVSGQAAQLTDNAFLDDHRGPKAEDWLGHGQAEKKTMRAASQQK